MTLARRAGPGALLLSCLLTGCATTHGPATPGDPFERMNRATHRFNDAIDRAVLKPVASGYRKGMPRVIRTGISNVLSHLAFPTTIVNDLLQLKLKDAAADLGRFVLNSTLGLGGLLDPATDAGIPRNDEDFGQTLGRWGVPPGPYLVLPLLGPSTLRDAPSMAVDAQTDLRVQLELDDGTQVALGVLSVVSGRAELLALDDSLGETYDPYAFLRNAWLQRREYKVRDGEVPEEAPLEDFEDFDDVEDPVDPVDQAAPAAPATSSAATSLIPASAASGGGMFR
ncbi:MAG: VacJ family lipoprotein [Steroidobacteraceae bacterium]